VSPQREKKGPCTEWRGGGGICRCRAGTLAALKELVEFRQKEGKAERENERGGGFLEKRGGGFALAIWAESEKRGWLKLVPFCNGGRASVRKKRCEGTNSRTKGKLILQKTMKKKV